MMAGQRSIPIQWFEFQAHLFRSLAQKFGFWDWFFNQSILGWVWAVCLGLWVEYSPWEGLHIVLQMSWDWAKRSIPFDGSKREYQPNKELEWAWISQLPPGPTYLSQRALHNFANGLA